MGVYADASCMEQESDPRIEGIWERFLRRRARFPAVADLMRVTLKRDPPSARSGAHHRARRQRELGSS